MRAGGGRLKRARAAHVCPVFAFRRSVEEQGGLFCWLYKGQVGACEGALCADSLTGSKEATVRGSVSLTIPQHSAKMTAIYYHNKRGFTV